MNKLKKAPQRHFQNQNPLESLLNIGQGATDSIVKDLAAPLVSGFWEQFIGVGDKEEKHGGQLQEGQEIDLKQHRAETAEPAIDYHREIIHADKASSKEGQEIRIRVEEILVEIKKLANSSQELQSQFRDVVAETQIANPGKYHENLLEWIYSIVKQARMRIEESAGWMSAMHSKKDRKYWAMFKKHGTSFGLSNERSVATQVG